MVHNADKRIHSARQANTPLGHTLSLITHASSPVRFLILDCPTESTLPIYMQEFLNYNVTTVVRCCQPTYNTKHLDEKNIAVVDLPFKDGGVPPPTIINQFLNIVNKAKSQASESEPVMIAVHCVAGLGRAPVLVAIAMIEMGMAPLDAIEYIRQKRRGAFNKPQIVFLDSYQQTSHSSSFRSSIGRMFGFGPKTFAIVSQQT